jgi:hypothetical protein
VVAGADLLAQLGLDSLVDATEGWAPIGHPDGASGTLPLTELAGVAAVRSRPRDRHGGQRTAAAASRVRAGGDIRQIRVGAALGASGVIES